MTTLEGASPRYHGSVPMEINRKIDVDCEGDRVHLNIHSLDKDGNGWAITVLKQDLIEALNSN